MILATIIFIFTLWILTELLWLYFDKKSGYKRPFKKRIIQILQYLKYKGIIEYRVETIKLEK